jgi:alanine dehydrogenase
MNIAVLKEIKVDENRVSLQPFQVSELVKFGHKVYVETNAGLNAGFSDLEYERNGALIADKYTVLNNSELILKVKAPLEIEYTDYKSNQILFTYLHFDENIPAEQINKLISSGFTGIAYEWVGRDSDFPLLYPMSRLTGYLFAQKSSELLSKHKGKLGGKYESEHTGANVLIIGLGTIGMSAFKYLYDNKFNITLLDKNIDTINQRLNSRFYTHNINYTKDVNLIKFDTSNPENTKKIINNNMTSYDIILNCAVRRKDLLKSKMEYLIDKEMISKMQKGSIVCDTTACDMDLIETCISSSELEQVDIIDGIVHYNCDHIPSYVANTSTKLLTEQTFQYVLLIANNGIEHTIKTNEYFRNGVSCKNGYITHRYSAEKKNLLNNYKDILELIK